MPFFLLAHNGNWMGLCGICVLQDVVQSELELERDSIVEVMYAINIETVSHIINY